MFAGQDTDRLQGLPEPHVCNFGGNQASVRHENMRD